MDGYGSGNRESLISIYRFLQRLFLEPDKEFYGFLQDNTDGLRDIGITIDENVDLESLQVEYTGLFLGPKDHLPPYESVFLEGRFWGERSADVKDFIKRIGLATAEEDNMPPDHVAVELEVLEKLLATDHADAEEYYKRFFEEHLLWVFDFLERINQKAKLEFYKTSFEFAANFLASEKKRLGI